MSSSGAIKAGRAFIELFGEDSKLVRTLTANKKRLKDWGKQITGIGTAVLGASAAILGPLSGAAKMFSDMGSDMADMSGRTGASVEALSSLGYAAEQSGATLEDLEAGLRKQSKFLTEAAQGGKEQTAVLQRLGLTMGQLAQMSPEDQFRTIADRVGKIQNPTLRAATAMEVFGKSGTKLLPMIGQLGELEARASALGLVMSGEDASAADTLGDAWGDLLGVGKMLIFQVGAALAPMLTELVSAAVNITSGFIRWVQANREAIVTVAKIAAIVGAVGAGLVALGALLSAAGVAAGILASAVVFCGTVLSAIAAAFAFLISPVGLVLTALAALTTWFFTCTEIGQQAVQFIVDAFMGLWNDVSAAVAGIRDALATGDWGAAVAIAGSFLKVQWAKITVFLWDAWNNFLSMFLTGTIDVAKRVSKIFIAMGIGILEQVATASEGLSKLLGKNIIDPKKLDAIRFTLPMVKTLLTGAADDKLNAFGGSVAASGAAGSVAAADDLAQARADFDNSVKAAANARTKFEAKRPKGEGNLEVPDLRAGLETAKLAVSGTFSAAAAGGLGGSKQLDKIADATQATAKGIKQLVNKKNGLITT